MTQIGGVFRFPLLETTEEVVNTQPEPAHYRASYPTILTSEIKINGTAERLFYVLGNYVSLNDGH